MVDQQHNKQDAQSVNSADAEARTMARPGDNTKRAGEADTQPKAGPPKDVPGAAGGAPTEVGTVQQAGPAGETVVERRWYIIHTQTGQEMKVKAALESKIQRGLAGDQVTMVLVPTERVTEVRAGKKRISERKFFPGYLLVEMQMTDESWHLVRTTQGVTGFIGAGRRPVALSDEEVAEIRRQTEERKDKPTPRVSFQKGEGVRVIEGPFTNFSGEIEEVNIARGKLKVLVSIFGRQTPVELEFWQVERL